MTIEYLLPYKQFCKLDELSKLKDERDNWYNRDSSKDLRDFINSMPDYSASSINYSESSIEIGKREDLNDSEFNLVLEKAKQLIPWRKGPFTLFGELIDAEWRSDFKWERLKEHLDDMQDKKILDIGCNNGYFMFKMAEENPELVLGIDPVLDYKTQFEFIQNYIKNPNLHFELFGVEHLPYFKDLFDIVFSMGIIYHHRHPLEQLINIRESLVPGGQMILETIGIPGEDSIALFPEDRYAKMRNVFFVPTLSCLINWTKKAKFTDVEVISSTPLTPDEQRLTPWCPPPHQSLEDFLDPNDKSKTFEGHPAPMRFCIKARRKKGTQKPKGF
jgi:tRNA (mo5U34)-methyltransferase